MKELVMRWVMLAGVLLAAACAEGNGAATHEDAPDLATAECAEEEFQDWNADFAEDAQGASTPEGALEFHDAQTAPLPSGQPVRVSEGNGQVSFAFLDDGVFAGRASVRGLDNGWLVEGAVVCY